MHKRNARRFSSSINCRCVWLGVASWSTGDVVCAARYNEHSSRRADVSPVHEIVAPIVDSRRGGQDDNELSVMDGQRSTVAAPHARPHLTDTTMTGTSQYGTMNRFSPASEIAGTSNVMCGLQNCIQGCRGNWISNPPHPSHAHKEICGNPHRIPIPTQPRNPKN